MFIKLNLEFEHRITEGFLCRDRALVFMESGDSYLFYALMDQNTS